ncbi:S-DNA-T family DNA segregation ATPase FtsK/SpoIIIE [Herbihabitans rhizosphaerae]|uniref:S-DNA-T family DNA segregation ATPase FtsK/SpoIIIE n=1 Tax=Herbihabitans rhizosphaerae TaxID=1872711 RepID=A0A4Q7L0U6_9PSEU|nr:type VII secretion protein EccCa [Herbihabitans rhizosphaerae]RZS43089.1 S-DNA-T family DNA segregation ATPase FtsK/SpoIIIE [Herbihabitans rhizosphaerae]
MTETLFRRPPRLPVPSVPDGEVALRPPPELPRPDSGGGWLTALPALSGLGSVAYLFAGPPSPITYVAGSFFLFSSLAIVVCSLLRSRSSQKGDTATTRRDYLRYLVSVRAQVRKTADAQREHLEWTAPEPGVLWSLVDDARLWERRSSDEDFGVVRLGTGPRYLATPLVPAESGAVEDLDPLAAQALKRFVTTHTAVPDLPVQASLRRFAGLSITGDRAAARALARAVIAHAVTFHSPKDLRVAVCADVDGADWSWVKWLPHARHPAHTDHAGPARQTHRALAVLEEMLGDELTRRSRFNRHGEPDPDLPHVLVVLDGAAVTGEELVLAEDGLQAVTVLDLDGVADELVRAHGLALRVDSDRTLTVRTAGRDDHLGTADTLAPASAAALAQQLAGYRLDADTTGDGDLSAASKTLPQLLGITDPAAIDLATSWKPRPVRDRLRVPIGIAADGTVLELDVKESAQDGMGPHGLLVGATGSGKSELLRTLVLGMAATHSPEQLNMVLVDFKGGATFADLGRLPHVAATITNLEDDLALVDRMREALAGEMNRRQEILRDAGNVVSIRDYEQRRQAGAPLPPMPSLLIVVDEFSELLSQKPDFVDLFVQIGRLGRSLGLHLLLASQRLDEGRLRGLEAHLSYRIGLRTFSAEESRVAIGVPDAVDLPSAPGHGYLATEARTRKRFRAGYVSGAYSAPGRRGPVGPDAVPEVRPFPASRLPVPARLRAPAPGPADPKNEVTLLTVMVGQMAGKGTPAHRVWLPPLEAPEPLDALLPGVAVRPDRGFCASPDAPELAVPIGIVDRPYHQRRDPLVIDLAGAGGHVAIVGGPQSGKSTTLRTLITGLSLRHTPDEVQFYAMDFSGALFSLVGLPHLGAVAGRQDEEVLHRIVAEVTAVVEHRETRFRELGVDGMAAYRKLRANGAVPSDTHGDPFGDVFLVVDGWAVLRQDHEDLEERILNLVSRALTYGVHVVVTANRWLDLRLGLRDLMGTKIELKLGDPLDSEIDRRTQEAVPVDRPGRGVSRDRAHFLGAVPRVDGVRGADDLGAGVADLIGKIDGNWPGAPAPPVRLLPALLEYDELPTDGGLAIGLEGQRLGPVVLDRRTDPGLVLIGDAESGKTSTLRAIARQVVDRARPREDKIVLIDYRFTMLGEFDGDCVLGYANNQQQVVDVVAGLVEGFTKRLPGPDVTPEELRTRSWWTGPDVHIVVDDYDLVATSAGNPLLPLLEFVPQARSLGLHLYVSRAAGGAGRAVLDPVLGRLRELAFPTVVLSAPVDEGPLFGVRPIRQRPGRGTLVHRTIGTVPVQLARLDTAR